MSKIRRIGWWFSEEKTRKLKFLEFIQFCESIPSLELVRLDFDQSLDDQGPFDLIIHKINDLIIEADNGCDKAHMQVKRFQTFLDRHPETIALDNFYNASRLLDRYVMYAIVQESEICKKDNTVFIPKFVEISTNDIDAIKSKLHESDMKFPVVVKPYLAEVHDMALVFNLEGLQDLKAPYIAQEFVNHSATLYKLYIVGDDLFFVERPSLKNFTAKDNATIFFHTFDVSKEKSSVFLTKMDFGDQCGHIPPKEGKLKLIADSIKQVAGMKLLGIDVIIEDETGKYAIIDINAFPGYNCVPDFFKILIDFMLDLIEKNRLKGHQPLLHSPPAPLLI